MVGINIEIYHLLFQKIQSLKNKQIRIVENNAIKLLKKEENLSPSFFLTQNCCLAKLKNYVHYIQTHKNQQLSTSFYLISIQ